MRNRAVEVPDWLSYHAIYQINPRTFSGEGTIRSITEKLDFLCGLGFRVLYLCPVFKEDSSSDETFWSERQKASGTRNPKNPYRISDYFKIDEEYGCMEDLQEFISQAHRRKMKVLLDLVYLHMGVSAPILARHPEYARQNEKGEILCNQWHFASLDFNCAGLREYLWSNMVYLIDETDADGFRCDVGDAVPIDFWDEGKKRIRRIKRDAVLICEGSNLDYLCSSFESSYHFAWHEELYRLLEGESDAQKLKAVWEEYREKMPFGGLVLRDLDNHDTVTDWPVRAEKLAGHDKMEAVIALNYIIDGIPMLYCGNELADSSRLSMFANRFHPGNFRVTDWRIQNEEFSLRRQRVIRTLNELRAKSDILRYGETVWTESPDQEKLVAFERQWNGESIAYAGNFGTESVEFKTGTLAPENVLAENRIKSCTDSLEIQPGGYLVKRVLRAEGKF